MAIDAITIGERFRKELGDLKSLAASIDEVGLLHPVVVTLEGVLIAGQRRLEACKLLGKINIPVTVIALDEIVRAETAEDFERLGLTISEKVAIKQALEPIEKAAAKARRSGWQYAWQIRPMVKSFHKGSKVPREGRLGDWIELPHADQGGSRGDAAESDPGIFREAGGRNGHGTRSMPPIRL